MLNASVILNADRKDMLEAITAKEIMCMEHLRVTAAIIPGGALLPAFLQRMKL